MKFTIGGFYNRHQHYKEESGWFRVFWLLLHLKYNEELKIKGQK